MNRQLLFLIVTLLVIGALTITAFRLMADTGVISYQPNPSGITAPIDYSKHQFLYERWAINFTPNLRDLSNYEFREGEWILSYPGT